jgi:hypothetical protein
VVASLSNAAANLDAAPGGRADGWIDTMRRVAATGADVDSLLRAGQVAGWRAGLAVFRSSALEAASALAPDDLGAVFGADPVGLVDRLRADRWFDPAEGTSRTAPTLVGGFRGLGGPFLRPPTVVVDAGDLLATDGYEWWLVVADAFGSATVRVPAPTGAPSPTGAPPATAGEPPGAVAAIPEVTSWVRSEGCLAVTSALSHRVTVLPEPA